MSGHYVYVIECMNGALYTGYTIDVEKRYLMHCRGTASCKYTRSFPPKRLCAAWKVSDNKSDALAIEYRLKQLSHAQKWAVIGAFQNTETLSLDDLSGLMD